MTMMSFNLQLLFGVIGIYLALTASEADQDVFDVSTTRSEGGTDVCRYNEVCADTYNFTHFGRLETILIPQCNCPSNMSPCGKSADPMLFKETRTHSMTTCEPALYFKVCVGDQIAKEQHHNLVFPVYEKINCICPNNGNPGNFSRKMTTVKRWNNMTSEEREYAQRFPGSRFFKCRDFGSGGH